MKLFTGLVLSLIPTMITPPAAAADDAAQTAAQHTRIAERLEAATKLFESNLPADALEVLEQVEGELGADGEARFPQLRFMMARCLVELERPDEALAALKRFRVLAQDETQRQLADDWSARIGDRFYGELRVDCPEGGTARLEGQHTPEARPCPATFETVRAGGYTVAVDGLDGPLVADADVTAGGAVSVTPAPPPPDSPWLWGVASISGGPGLMGGGLPDGIEAGVGPHLLAELMAEAELFDGFRVRLGVGFDHAHLVFDDTELEREGDWIRGSLLVPLDLRVALPWDLAVTVGGGLDVLLFADEDRDDRTTDVTELLTPLGAVARLGLERAVYADGLEVRVALRFQRWLTPVFESVEPVMQTLDLGVLVAL